MLSLIPLAESSHRHFARELFESAFPISERPDFSSLRNRNNDLFHFMVATNSSDEFDQPVGILSYWNFPDLVYIEHFAIHSELRGQGLGKAVFLNFLSQQTSQVVLEVEPPHDELSEHRIDFYRSMGLTITPYQYLQPSYHNDDTTVPLLIMTKYEINDDEFAEIREILYRQVYHCIPQ